MAAETSGWLPPDPRRAEELSPLRPDLQPEDMVRQIWPISVYSRHWREGFPVYTRAMELYTKSVPIHHFSMALEEGFLSIAAGVNVPDAYILLPEAGFFEFLPVSGDGFALRP